MFRQRCHHQTPEDKCGPQDVIPRESLGEEKEGQNHQLGFFTQEGHHQESNRKLLRPARAETWKQTQQVVERRL